MSRDTQVSAEKVPESIDITIALTPETGGATPDVLRTELATNANPETLHAKIGEFSLALAQQEEQISQLMGRIANLETMLNTQPGLEASILPPSEPVHELSLEHPTKTDIVSEKFTSAATVEANSEGLSDAQQRYENILLFLIDMPETTLTAPNAGKILRDTLGLTKNQGGNALTALQNDGMVILHKDSTGSRRSTALSLNLENLTQNLDRAYVTPRVVERLQALLDVDNPHKIKAPRRETTQASPSNGSDKLPMSRRVRKMVGQEPDPPTFLTHRPASTRHTEEKSLAEDKPIRQPERQLRFSLRIKDKQRLEKTFSPRAFSELEPYKRLLLAMGHSAAFFSNTTSQKEYAAKIVNKNVGKKSVVSGAGIGILLQQAIKEGAVYINGHAELTPKALETLGIVRRGQPNKQKTVAVLPDEEPEATYIATSPIPAADRSAPIELQHQVMRTGARLLDILSDLEVAPDFQITAEKLHDQFRKNMNTSGDAGSYIKPLASLVTKGFVTLKPHGSLKTAELTREGQDFVATLKAYPELLREYSSEKLSKRTSYQILKYISDATQGDPESWLQQTNSSEPVLAILSEALEISPVTLTRRLYALREQYKYIEVQKMNTSDGTQQIVNIRLTALGLERIIATEEKCESIEKKCGEDLLDEDEVWNIEQMTETCVELATELGHTRLAQSLTEAREKKHLFEFTEQDFAIEQHRITNLLERLRKDYALVKSAT